MSGIRDSVKDHMLDEFARTVDRHPNVLENQLIGAAFPERARELGSRS